MHRYHFLLAFWLTLASGFAWAKDEALTTKFSAGFMDLHQTCHDCIESHYRLIPLSVGLRRGEYSLQVATNLMELKRPEIDKRYSGYSETLITLSHQQLLAGRRLWGSELKLKVPTESEPELGNGSTDVEFALKGMAGVGSGWLTGKLAKRWREGDSAELYDTQSVELGLITRLGERDAFGLRAVYRDKTANTDLPERELMPYLSFRLKGRQRVALYVLNSQQGASRKLGAGLHYSYQLSL